MRFGNTSTPTFAGSAGSGLGPSAKPSVAERMNLYDDAGNVIAYYDKAVDGSISLLVNGYTVPLGGATAAELDRFNDVSAYQESVTAAVALTLTSKYHGLAVASGGAVTLAAPPATMLGQVKVIEMVTDDGDVTLALTNVVGGSASTTATFNDAGDQLVLIAGAAKWIVLKEQGVSLA